VNVDGVKITWVSLDESVDQRDRPGYVHPCQYGAGVPCEPNEAGAIVELARGGKPELHPSGVWTIPCRYVERIFIVEPE
jgi:hypothetical protein